MCDAGTANAADFKVWLQRIAGRPATIERLFEHDLGVVQFQGDETD